MDDGVRYGMLTALLKYFKNDIKPILPARILYIINDPAFFLSHRLPIAMQAKNAGYDVVVATGPGDKVEKILAAGFRYHCLPLTRGGMNPLAELRLLCAIARLYLLERPDLVHLVTIKPVLYGGILARFLKVPAAVAAINGMGYLFVGDKRGGSRRLAEFLYHLALGHSNGRIIVQNKAAWDGLKKIGALGNRQDVLIPMVSKR